MRVFYETSRGPVKAVEGVSFSLRAGERLGLIGESGSGKTTLATALARLTRAPGRISGGRVLLQGRDVLAMSQSELRHVRMSEISFIPQGAMNSLNPVMRIGDQLIDGIIAHGRRQSRSVLNDRVRQLLINVGLPPGIVDRYPHQLSGGQKQRVVMAIAAALDPKVIVADEPTSALDVVVQRQVMQALGRLQKGIEAAVILVGHDMGLIAQFADTVGVLYAGKLVELGSVADVLKKPLHPYTRLLIDSLPTLDSRKELRSIPGLPPALLDLPPGCSFHPRCPYAFDRCSKETPIFRAVEAGRLAACHLYPTHSFLPTLVAAAPAPRNGSVTAPAKPAELP